MRSSPSTVVGSGSLRSGGRAHRARLPDRPENLLCLADPTSVSTHPLGHRYHRSAGRLLRARRARTPQARSVVRRHQDVGSTATPRHRRGPLHRGTTHARPGLAGCAPPQKVRSTTADPAAARAADLIKRQFRVRSPSPPGPRGWVSTPAHRGLAVLHHCYLLFHRHKSARIQHDETSSNPRQPWLSSFTLGTPRKDGRRHG